MKKAYWIWLFVLWVACKDKTETQNIYTPTLQGYFPIKTGKYVTYTVDSTFYDGFYTPTKVTKAHYTLKEIVADSFLDANNQLNYRIERYRRNADSGAWNVFGVSYVVISSTTVERVDDNLRFINLVAPINLYTHWQGNAHINTTLSDFSFLDGWQYQYTTIDAPVTLNGIIYKKTINVKQIDAADAIQDRQAYEQYAQGIGLVYKQFTFLNNFNFNTLPYPDIGWPARATDGFSIIMTIKDHN